MPLSRMQIRHHAIAQFAPDADCDGFRSDKLEGIAQQIGKDLFEPLPGCRATGNKGCWNWISACFSFRSFSRGTRALRTTSSNWHGFNGQIDGAEAAQFKQITDQSIHTTSELRMRPIYSLASSSSLGPGVP